MWQNLAYFLIGASVLSVTGWAAWYFFTAADVPLLIRIAAGSIGTGVVILTGVAIKDRITKAREGHYEGVEN